MIYMYLLPILTSSVIYMYSVLVSLKKELKGNQVFFYSCCMLMKPACMVLSKPCPVQKHQPILFIQEIWLCDCSHINWH